MAALLPAGLALIMFTVGLRLAPADFVRLFERPRPVVVGLANQMLVLPALAVALVVVWRIEPAFALGLILLAVCPGGITSNLLTVLAGGDLALALTVTAISTVASVATLPLVVAVASEALLGQGRDIPFPFAQTLGAMVLTTGLPVAAALGLRAWRSSLAERIEPALRRVAVAVFAAIVVFTFASNAALFGEHGATVGPVVLSLNLAATAIAWASSRLAGLDRAQAVAVTLECGLQNAALAIYVAVGPLGDVRIAVPAILYAVAMNATALGVILARRGFARA
ncbi:MAG: bile acid:sodium symporter family protein [Alphaproteobacteria bacterium]|nr:bile acid:sodium symporter family protein [Alphaproteobacteria bacterium]